MSRPCHHMKLTGSRPVGGVSFRVAALLLVEDGQGRGNGSGLSVASVMVDAMKQSWIRELFWGRHRTLHHLATVEYKRPKAENVSAHWGLISRYKQF